MKAIFMTNHSENVVYEAYDQSTREQLEESLEFVPPIFKTEELENRKQDLQEVEFIFSTWGMFQLSQEQIAQFLPKLKAVFYAAGSVQGFARPYISSKVRVFSAYAANAVPVAEFTVAQIILAGKGFYQSSQLYKTESWKSAHDYACRMPCNYGASVGIIGAGAIGTIVIELLKSYNLPVLVFDPFLSNERADALNVRKVSLEELFEKCQVISNHLANNAQTKGMLNYDLFRRMKTTATFINTGRGAQVVEDDLVRALQEEPARTALLDVTEPEPVQPEHPFMSMDNVILTPHIAGSMRDEIARMGRYMYEEFVSFSQNLPTRFEVTEKMLETMA